MLINDSTLTRFCTVGRLVLSAAFLLVTGCSSLKPVDLPDEYSAAPAQTTLWTHLDTVRSDDWLHLLNTGDEAIDWRLRLIDSANEELILVSAAANRWQSVVGC